MSEGSSPRGDASSEISGFTAASMLTERAPSTRGLTPAADLALDRWACALCCVLLASTAILIAGIAANSKQYQHSAWTGALSRSVEECNSSQHEVSVPSYKRLCHDGRSHASCRSIADGSRRAERQQTSASGALDSTLGEEGPNLRLGMRIEQRGNVKRLVRAMKQRLDAASLDLQVSGLEQVLY